MSSEVSILFSLKITEELIYLVGPKPAAGELCLWELPVLANQTGPWLFPGSETKWHSGMVCILHTNPLPSYKRVALLTVPLGNSPLAGLCFKPHWSFAWGNIIWDRARWSHWASSQAEKMIICQCLSLVLVPFWFAGIDEVDGISIVVTYVVCG